MLARAQATAAYARRTGCGIEEAGEILRESGDRPAAGLAGRDSADSVSSADGATGASGALSRRAVLGGAGAAALGMILRRPCPALAELTDITAFGGWRAYLGR